MTDKIGGKYILMSGLILFGGGMGWLALIATPTSSWQSFLAPLIVAGFGMGCVFAPLVTTAMRNIEPQMAGAASGVLNTVRQVGLVIGTATVGALLQNRLVSDHDQPGQDPRGGAAGAGARPVHHRDPEARPATASRSVPARTAGSPAVGPSGPAWPPRWRGSATTCSPLATWRPCARPCCCP